MKILKNPSVLSVLAFGLFVSGCNGSTDPSRASPANLSLICRTMEKHSFDAPLRDDEKMRGFEISDAKENGDQYRFKGDRLYILDKTRDAGEYFYNQVANIGPNLYRSGYMIFALQDAPSGKPLKALVTHADNLQTSISLVHCAPGAKD